MVLPWSELILSFLPVWMSHSLTVLSAAPVTRCVVSQRGSRAQTAPWWPSKVPSLSPLREYQTLG